MSDLARIEEFLEFKERNHGRSERTVQAYRLALTRLQEFLGVERSVLDASADELVAFTGPWLHKRKVVARSRRPYIAAVREFYRWLAEKKHISANVAAGVPYPDTGRQIPTVMSLASAEKLMWSPDFETFEGVRDGAMLSLLIGCGIRVTGLVRLNSSDLSEQMVDDKPRLFIRVHEKGDRQRLVPVPPQADLQLRIYLEHPDLKVIDRALTNGDQVMFVTTRNRNCPPHEYRGDRRRFNRRSVLQMIKQYGQRHEIPAEQLHPHAMRHLFGTELAEGKVDMLVIQQLLGHIDPKSTSIYTHLAMRRLVQEVDRAAPLAKMHTPASDILKRLKA